VADYHDLLDAIARVRSATGDPSAWQTGLSGDDIAVASRPISSPEAISAVLAKVIAAHRDVFATTPVAAAPPPQTNDGSAAEAIREAESALAQQHSTAAQTDLQVVRAVLGAHATQTAGQAQLDRVQQEIETAVLTRTGLDTPAGAREFQRFLIGQLRDIQAVLDTAGLDATSHAALASALAALYASSSPHEPPGVGERPVPTPQPQSAQQDSSRSTEPADRRNTLGSEDPWDDFGGLPTGLPADLPTGLPADLPADIPAGIAAPADTVPLPPAPVAAAPAPAMSAMPASAPAAWGAGPPGSMPLGGGLPPLPGSEFAGLSPGTGFGSGFDPAEPRRNHGADDLDHLLDRAFGEPSAGRSDDPAEEPEPPAVREPAGEPADPATSVLLPDGDTVAARTPELAAAITAAVAGTPIPEAFGGQGITVPPPGSPVAAPLDPERLVAGDIGVFTDRHAVALGNGKALLDGQIQPISAATGPGFLGWQQPPRPDPATSTPEIPAPNRPAQTAPS
jgi:hypothetical protein